MTRERMLDAAQLLGEFGNGKMANELMRLANRYCWRPIRELHEDYGPCVIMNIEDPGYLEVASANDCEFDESRWTHFSQIVPLGCEEAERMKAEWMKEKRGKVMEINGKQILALPMEKNDSGASTIGGYFKEILKEFMREKEGFSGKRPFGNSGWEYELYKPLIVAKAVHGTLDEFGCIDECDESECERLLNLAIEAL